MEKEILIQELTEEERKEVLEYIKDIIENEKPKVAKMFKEVFKDEVNELFIMDEEQQEITEDFKAEVVKSLNTIERIKKEVFKILQDQQLLANTNPERFYDLAILLEQEIFIMNKYISILSTRYHRRIIDLMARYDCSRKQAEDRAMAEKIYSNYKMQNLNMDSLNELILLLKKRGQIN
ncbi:MAG: hypothetical protein EOL97_14085 [Spirochaetia bacterium]|nr:hypothetical protein [Spirochaetia bacterium]